MGVLKPNTDIDPAGGQDQLRHGAARRGGYSEDALLRCCAPECGEQAGDETIKILRRHIDVSCVVLRSYSYALCSICLRTLGECAETSRFAREDNRQEDSNRRSSKDLFQAHSMSPQAPITSSP